MAKKCAATTKSGSACSRNAIDGSEYCSQHAALNVASAVAGEAAETVSAAASAATGAASAATSKVKGEAKDGSKMISDALEQLRTRINELSTGSLNFSPSEYSPDKLYSWLKENVNEFEFPVVNELNEKLEGKTASDFRNRETWTEIWAIVSHSIQQEVTQAMGKADELTSPMREKAQERLDGIPTLGETRAKVNENAAVKKSREFVEGLPGVKQGQEMLSKVPGAATVNSLGEELDKVAPKDLLDGKTWSNFWTVVNHSLSEELAALRNRNKAEVEDIIIDVE